MYNNGITREEECTRGGGNYARKKKFVHADWGGLYMEWIIREEWYRRRGPCMNEGIIYREYYPGSGRKDGTTCKAKSRRRLHGKGPNTERSHVKRIRFKRLSMEEEYKYIHTHRKMWEQKRLKKTLANKNVTPTIRSTQRQFRYVHCER